MSQDADGNHHKCFRSQQLRAFTVRQDIGCGKMTSSVDHNTDISYFISGFTRLQSLHRESSLTCNVLVLEKMRVLCVGRPRYSCHITYQRVTSGFIQISATTVHITSEAVSRVGDSEFPEYCKQVQCSVPSWLD